MTDNNRRWQCGSERHVEYKQMDVKVEVKRWLVMSLLTMGVLLPCMSAHGQEIDLGLAKAKLCLACHQVDGRRVGPSFRVIAERYGNSPGALEYLAQSIRDGGRGRWGAITMPRQPQVSESDALNLAQWILSLAPQP